MDAISIILVLKVLVFLSAFFLFIVKYRIVQRYKIKHRRIGARWILWYDSLEIQGTSSQSRRDFMLTHNRLSFIMWACLLIGVLLLILPV